MCCVCSEPVRQANVRNHLLSHVFTLVMVPWLTSDKCPFDNCKVQGGTDLIYGESLHHIGEAHLLKSIEFLNNDLVRSMTGSGLDLLELQLTIQSLLKSQVCIYCFEPLGVDAAVHMQNHLVQIVESSTDDNMDCCELCDGFPCFDSVAELRAHLVKEHFRLKTELASLTMNNIEEKRRLAVGNSNKEKPISNKKKRCMEEEFASSKRIKLEDNDGRDDPLKSLILGAGEIEDDDEKEFSLRENIADLKKEENILLGVVNDHLVEQFIDEPGLTTLYPRKIFTEQESGRISGEARHSWLCEGRLLHLFDAVSPHNIALFKHQWARGQPVLISKSDMYLNARLWHPNAFMQDFAEHSADLVNTLTGKTVPKQPLRWFWEGFNSVSQRLVDSQGTPMLLKLKDWPPDGDIADFLPKRYNDLINNFPIQAYTLREGRLNLASYMPDYFLKPELGPKMYIAYGNALYSERASTNLHLDMSDAVNLLVYVGLPDDCDPQENIKCVLEQVDEAGCDIIMRRRVRDEGLLPGAIWHIFHPGDTNKIRDLLVKVALEAGKKLDPHDDPIHDQSTYLDPNLRMRLYREYGVTPYTIIQCAGDTVFIPAGACHQVRNLHNCIKIAEDFVSPELANNCLHLTQEFRHLTEHHTNHEDKLQIKNIIYHSVKNAVARLKQEVKKKEDETSA